MNIEKLVDVVKDIALNKLNLKSFYVGNTWNQSSGKGDIYTNLWMEMPILTEYQISKILSKQLTFSLMILDLAASDNIEDELRVISSCEELSDLFLYYLHRDPDIKLTGLPTGISVKNVNADNACGIRLDIKVNTGRVCLT